MVSLDKTYRNLLLIVVVIVILGITSAAIEMATLLNDNDVTLMGRHEMAPGMFWGMLFGMAMDGIIIIAFFYFLFQLVMHREGPQGQHRRVLQKSPISGTRAVKCRRKCILSGRST